jgi:hypothetical protein
VHDVGFIYKIIQGCRSTEHKKMSKSFKNYLTKIPNKHEIKELEERVILSTAHILRKVLI